MAAEDVMLSEKEALEAFTEVVKTKSYPKQAEFFLNAFWKDLHEQAEEVWGFVHDGFMKIDKAKESGHSLDEVESFRLLQLFAETRTALELRADLKKVDVDSDKKMSLLEYCLLKFESTKDMTVVGLMSKKQGTNDEVEKASAVLAKVVAELELREKKLSGLKEDAKLSGVKGMRAKNQVAVMESEDQLPLRKALITCKAALKKAKKSDDVHANGQIWWCEREMIEAEKYKPKRNIGSPVKKKFGG